MSKAAMSIGSPQPKTLRAKNKVARDGDVIALLALFIDQDGADALDPRSVGLTPDLTVTTGTTPEPRYHHYFFLPNSMREEDWRVGTRALIEATHSDPACKNPSRMLRLPGTVSYPDNSKIGRGYVAELVTWQRQDLSNSDRTTTEEKLAEIADSLRKREQERCHAKAVDCKQTQDPTIIYELQRRHNTLPVQSYEDWRNLAFGTRAAYRGTSLEDQAFEAFLDFSNRWENGTTTPEAVRKLWESEAEKEGRAQIGPGTAIFLLRRLPVRGPAPDMISANLPPAAEQVGLPHIDEQFTGLVKLLAKQFDNASDREASTANVAAVLAALSAVFGPCSVIQNGVKGKCCTNLYVMALARTGFGKENVRQLVNACLAAARREVEILEASPSDVSCHSALAKKGGRLALMIDEGGILLKAIRSSSQSHQRLLLSFLMQAFGRGLAYIEPREYRDHRKNIEKVDNPRPSIVLTSTVADFVSAVTTEDSDSGFLNRYLVFALPNLPRLKSAQDPVDGQAIVDFPEVIKDALCLASGIDMGSALPARLPEISIYLDDDARSRVLLFKCREVEGFLQSGDRKANSWARAVEHVQRIAGLLAVSDAIVSDRPELENVACTLGHVDLAIAIVRGSLRQLEEIVTQAGQSKNRTEMLKDRILKQIHDGGGKCSRTQLNRGALRGASAEERVSILEVMIEDGEIRRADALESRPGPKAEMFELAAHPPS